MKANVAAIMIAVTVQYQSEPRTVMAISARELLTASSGSVVSKTLREALECGKRRTVDLKCLVTHIDECLGFKGLRVVMCSVVFERGLDRNVRRGAPRVYSTFQRNSALKPMHDVVVKSMLLTHDV
jgi:hypothetical protein